MGLQRDLEAEVSRSGAFGSGTVTGLLFLKATDFDSSGLVTRGQTRSNTLFSLMKKRKKRAIVLWLRVFVSGGISVETEREKKILAGQILTQYCVPAKNPGVYLGWIHFLVLFVMCTNGL